MHRKYIGKTCIYCGIEKSAAGDHVIAREFFPEDLRHGIPKVPACVKCNTRKSTLEQYLMTVLPFASNHPVAQRVVERKASARLAGNKKLHKELAEKSETIWVQSESGLILPTKSLPFKPEAAVDYFGMVAQGLLHHHTGAVLDGDYSTTAFALTKFGVEHFERKFWPPRAPKVMAHTLADGALRYRGRGTNDSPMASVWLIELYGGLGLRGAGADEGSEAELFGAITMRRKTLRDMRTLERFAI